MSKQTIYGFEIPKRVLGFKLSKGTRKDLGKLLKRLETPEVRALAMPVLSAAAAFVAERSAERKNAPPAPDRPARTDQPAKPH